MQTDTDTRYGTVSRALHWAMAACYLLMFATALAWNLNDALKPLIKLHKAAGLLLLLLALVRFVWALVHFQRRPAGGVALKAGHLALYALMFAVPASGMARQFHGAFGNAHGALAFVFFLLIAGHIAMTVLHQRRGEAILQRML